LILPSDALSPQRRLVRSVRVISGSIHAAICAAAELMRCSTSFGGPTAAFLLQTNHAGFARPGDAAHGGNHTCQMKRAAAGPSDFDARLDLGMGIGAIPSTLVSKIAGIGKVFGQALLSNYPFFLPFNLLHFARHSALNGL
jgi:hypothetical protein